MSLVVASRVQVGQSGTPTNNFVLDTPSTGVFSIGVGNSGSASQVFAINSTGNVTLGGGSGNVHTINGSATFSNGLTVSSGRATITSTVAPAGDSITGAILTLVNTTKPTDTKVLSLGSTNNSVGFIRGHGTFVALLGDQGNTLGTITNPYMFFVDSSANVARVVPGGTVLYPDFACRAWVNFTGSGTNGSQTIRGSGNVTSVSRTAASTYQINFTVPMPDVNYSVVQMCSRDGIGSMQSAGLELAPLSTSFTIVTRSGGGTAVDPSYVMLSVFR